MHNSHGKTEVAIHYPDGGYAGPRGTEFCIGIDDTDNLESRGTGFRARELAAGLARENIARVMSVTRHQLFVSPQVPYTSHNSSACIVVESGAGSAPHLAEYVESYLTAYSAAGSDAGYCVLARNSVVGEVVQFGYRAKCVLLSPCQAHDVAARAGALLEGVTGTHGGVIGALAAVGLYSGGGDGRYLWLHGIRETPPGRYSLGALRARTAVDEVRTRTLETVNDDTIDLDVSDWLRPVRLDGRAVLFVDEWGDSDANDAYWTLAGRDFVKRF